MFLACFWYVFVFLTYFQKGFCVFWYVCFWYVFSKRSPNIACNMGFLPLALKNYQMVARPKTYRCPQRCPQAIKHKQSMQVINVWGRCRYDFHYVFASCIYNKETMHDINIADDPYLSSTTVTPMFLLKTFSLFVPAICLSIGIFFPRFYCLHRGLLVMAMRNICPWSAYVKSDYPQILNLVVYRSSACIMNVRLERHILSLFLNHVVQPYFISRYMVETIISSGQSCKGNNIILQSSIFSTEYPLAASLPLGLLFGFAQVLILLPFIALATSYIYTFARHGCASLDAHRMRIFRCACFADQKMRIRCIFLVSYYIY